MFPDPDRVAGPALFVDQHADHRDPVGVEVEHRVLHEPMARVSWSVRAVRNESSVTKGAGNARRFSPSRLEERIDPSVRDDDSGLNPGVLFEQVKEVGALEEFQGLSLSECV